MPPSDLDELVVVDVVLVDAPTIELVQPDRPIVEVIEAEAFSIDIFEGANGAPGPPGPQGPPGPAGGLSLVVREVPAGVINGINAAFTLFYDPVAASEQVFLNGLLQESGGADYTISGKVVTFGAAPQAGDRVIVTYQRV